MCTSEFLTLCKNHFLPSMFEPREKCILLQWVPAIYSLPRIQFWTGAKSRETSSPKIYSQEHVSATSVGEVKMVIGVKVCPWTLAEEYASCGRRSHISHLGGGMAITSRYGSIVSGIILALVVELSHQYFRCLVVDLQPSRGWYSGVSRTPKVDIAILVDTASDRYRNSYLNISFMFR